MIEQQTINGKEVWLQVDPHPMQRPNPNTIPTEYFTARYFFQEPVADASGGEVIAEDDGSPKLFESPVAALAYARKHMESRQSFY